MNREENIKKIYEQAILDTIAEKNKAVLEQMKEIYLKESKAKSKPAELSRWRMIMESKISKLAAAAMILIAAVASINFWGKTTSTAYGIEQTIQASQSIRYLHSKNFKVGMEEPKEFWLEFDAQNNIKNIRAYMPEWESPSDGANIIVWQQGIAKIWYMKKNSLITKNDKRFSDNLMKSMQLLNPKSVMLNFFYLEKEGLVKLEIDEPSEKSKPITITSTNSSEVKNMGYDVDLTVIFIEQSTKLATKIEHYNLTENADYELLEWVEFSDYNQQIDPKIFTLDDEVSPETNRIDWSTEDIGLAQGKLTDKEIAVKIVRELYEALIAEDYDKAGRLYGNVSNDRMREKFAGIKITRIISIDEPIPHPSPAVGGFMVRCKLEVEKDGVISVYEPYGPAVRRVSGQPERWNIHGGITK